MKNKNYAKKGITLAVLVVTIIITMILVSAIVVSYDSIKNSTKKKEFAKEIYSIQNLVDAYKFKNEKYPVTTNVTFSIATIENEDKIQFINEPGYSSNEVVFRVIDLYEVGIESTTRGTQKNANTNDMYVVSENTGKVFYLKGEEIGDKVYYTLSDELKKEIGLTV